MLIVSLIIIANYLQVYFDFMRSFRTEFDDLFAEGLFSAVEIGLGSSGELRYPSFSERMGWRYPGIGEFQVSVNFNSMFSNVSNFIVFTDNVSVSFL